MNARFGTVNITTTPEGADVYIEGQVGSIGTTPMPPKKLEPGIYNFSLQHDLYESCDTTVNLSIGDEVDYSPKLARKTGSVTIFCDPPDATLYIDGKELGLAPQMLKNYPTGDYEIEAKPVSDEYATLTEIVTVKHNEKGQVEMKLSHGRTITEDNADNLAFWKTMKGHTFWVSSVCFSPDGNYVVSGSSDNTIKLWRVSDGKVIKTMKGHKGYVSSVCFSPDGKYMW
jgi:WD40 repeat protein